MHFSEKIKKLTIQEITRHEIEDAKKIRKSQAFIIKTIRRLCLDAAQKGLFYAELDDRTLNDKWAWSEDGECYIYFILRRLNLNWVKLEANPDKITGFGVQSKIVVYWV